MLPAGTSFLGDPSFAIDGMRFQYPIGVQIDPFTTSLYEKSKASMTRSPMTEARHRAESAGPRKRIAMACGRCRKRKIRCSGDQGDGQPCTNCSNANHSPCQFLRVNSCETHYRMDEINYSVGLPRTTPARPHVVPLIGQLDEDYSHIYTPGHAAYRGDSRGYTTSHIRTWQPEPEPATPVGPYTLSTTDGLNACPDPYRAQQPRSHLGDSANTIYLGNAGLHDPNAYSFNNNGHMATLAFRPAPVVNVAGPSGPGTYPILNGMPGDANQGMPVPRHAQPNGPAADRHYLPATRTAYQTTSMSSSRDGLSPRSPASHPSPASVSGSSPPYGVFNSSPASVSTIESAHGGLNVKMDPEGTSEEAQYREPRLQRGPGVRYRHRKRNQYQQSHSNHTGGALQVAPTITSHPPAEATHTVTSPGTMAFVNVGNAGHSIPASRS